MVADWEALRDVPDHEVIGHLMEVVRNEVIGTYEQAGVLLPSRQYSDIGPSQHECEQFTISFIQMYLGTANQRANELQNCNAVRTIVLTLQVVRKAALPTNGRRGAITGQLDPAELTEAANTTTTDAWLLMDAVTGMVGDTLGIIADVSTAPRGGDFQAAVLNLSIGIP